MRPSATWSVGRWECPSQCSPSSRSSAQRVLEHKFYFDELYDALFYRPTVWLAKALYRGVEDPLIAESSTSLGQDTRDLGGIVARLQTGLLRTYVLAIASGAAVLAIVFIAVK
jgi:NADH-quinone oxidoreductase subunit L